MFNENLTPKLIPNSYVLSKFQNKFIKNGRKLFIINEFHKLFSNVKLERGVNSVNVLLRSYILMRHSILLLKYYTKTQSRKKRRKIPIYVMFDNTKINRDLKTVISFFHHLIFMEKKNRKFHKETPFQKIISTLKFKRKFKRKKRKVLSKKKTFTEHYYPVVLKRQSFSSLLKLQFTTFLNSDTLVSFKLKYLRYISKRRGLLRFRWRFIKKPKYRISKKKKNPNKRYKRVLLAFRRIKRNYKYYSKSKRTNLNEKVKIK